MKKTIYKICLCLLGIINVYAIDSNVCIVGTTGDYPPLTYLTESGYRGKDIQIFSDFAKSQNLVIKFVPTTWQTLSKDLSNNKFDVAIGGISENVERKKLFNLSDAIESSAKVPLIRCIDNNRFKNFSDIDNPNIIVAENRGGTSQDFALNNIKQATLLLYPKNQLAISSLNSPENKADVMFTDDVEVQYRHQITPELCQANIPEKFPGSNKVFLFSNNKLGLKLKENFNSWWKINKNKY